MCRLAMGYAHVNPYTVHSRCPAEHLVERRYAPLYILAIFFALLLDSLCSMLYRRLYGYTREIDKRHGDRPGALRCRAHPIGRIGGPTLVRLHIQHSHSSNRRIYAYVRKRPNLHRSSECLARARHGTGHYMTWQEILQHGGLDFDVFKSQLHDGRGKPVKAWGTFRWNQADKTARDASAATFLGVVGEDYRVINHASGFDLVDALMATVSGAHYETAGVLGNGEVVWGLADLGLSVRVGDDKSNAYLLFVTSHDGSYSYQLRGCMERVVCNNTLDIALSEKTKNVFKVRHTKNAVQRVTMAHEAIATVAGDVKSVEQKLQFLAGRKVTRESFNVLMGRIFPTKRDEDDKPAESSARRDNQLAEILSLYESNDGNAFPEQRGTAYNLLNAITEYTDHTRSTKLDGRAESAMFGSGRLLKDRALNLIVAEAENMPSKQQSIPVYDFADLGLNVPTQRAN